ncbi:IS66 Orf2 family protein [mine drainage metagenome]|uniref:IS66 Orf2 family protein n=1 Tax=mine drainage metagenome TaxID=410659 RepID=T1AP74_9ZZZZ
MIRFGGEDLKVYLYRDPVDMRKGRNCLAALAQEAMKVDPFSGALLIFVSRRHNAVKILYWHRNGFAEPSTKDPRHQVRTSAAMLSMASLVRT